LNKLNTKQIAFITIIDIFRYLARIFEDFEINSPSEKDIKNKVLILYHLTFHSDLSNTGFLNDFQ